MRNKITTKPSVPQPSLFHSFISTSCTSPLCVGAGAGNGACSSSFTSLCLCCSFLLTVFPRSRVGSLLWGAVLHKVLQNTLEHIHKVLAMDCGSSSIVPAWVLPERTQSCRSRLLQRGCPTGLPKACSCMDFSPQAAAPARTFFCGLCTGCSFFQSMSTCPGMGFSMGCGANSTSLPANTSSPSSFSDLAVCRVVSRIFLTPLPAASVFITLL